MYFVYDTDSSLEGIISSSDYYKDKGLDRVIWIGDTDDDTVEEVKWSYVLEYLSRGSDLRVIGIQKDRDIFHCSPHSIISSSARLQEVSDGNCRVQYVTKLTECSTGLIKSFAQGVTYTMPELLKLTLTSKLNIDGLSKWINRRIVRDDKVVLGRFWDGRYFLVNWDKTINNDIKEELSYRDTLSNLSLNDLYFYNNMKEAVAFCLDNNLNIINELYNENSNMFSSYSDSDWGKMLFDTLILQKDVVIEVNYFIRDLCYPLLCRLFNLKFYDEYTLYYSKSLREFTLVTEEYQIIFKLDDIVPDNDILKYGYDYKKIIRENGVCVTSARIRRGYSDISKPKVKNVPIECKEFSWKRSEDLLKDVFYL